MASIFQNEWCQRQMAYKMSDVSGVWSSRWVTSKGEFIARWFTLVTSNASGMRGDPHQRRVECWMSDVNGERCQRREHCKMSDVSDVKRQWNVRWSTPKASIVRTKRRQRWHSDVSDVNEWSLRRATSIASRLENEWRQGQVSCKMCDDGGERSHVKDEWIARYDRYSLLISLVL